MRAETVDIGPQSAGAGAPRASGECWSGKARPAFQRRFARRNLWPNPLTRDAPAVDSRANHEAFFPSVVPRALAPLGRAGNVVRTGFACFSAAEQPAGIRTGDHDGGNVAGGQNERGGGGPLPHAARTAAAGFSRELGRS